MHDENPVSQRKDTMPQQFNTIYQWRYEVSSPDECHVTDSSGRLILTAWPGTPEQFVADGQPVTLSSDSATLLSANGSMVVPSSSGNDSTGSGAALSATGEPVIPLVAAELTMRHATWFTNTTQSEVSVQPGAWRDEVMTCYLKTEIPVNLSGVNWLYGEPAMMEGFTFVIALQQVGETTILANLAYSVKQ